MDKCVELNDIWKSNVGRQQAAYAIENDMWACYFKCVEPNWSLTYCTKTGGLYTFYEWIEYKQFLMECEPYRGL